MIRGIDKFKEFFKDYQDQYVLIGGVACDLIFEERDLTFRATRDFDMVLIVEVLTPEFGKQFWNFIVDGGYENRVKSDGKPQYYRFDKPKSSDYPFMIELFARTESVFEDKKYDCRPIFISEEISSLSAILLNDDYYKILLSGRTIISDVPVLPDTHLVLFKAKAWLDLAERKALGQNIDSKNLNKHKNDVARIASLLSGVENCVVPKSVYDDMVQFIKAFEKEPPDMKALKISAVNEKDIVNILNAIYNIG